MKPTTIFIRSYKKDFPWLRYCLCSIAKFCTGFSGVEIAVPRSDVAEAEAIAGTAAHVFGVPDEPAKGYIDQQVSKMCADMWVPKGYVLYLDSDCIVVSPITPDSRFDADGRIPMLVTPWDKVGEAICWKEPTERAIGIAAPYETMRRHPLVYPTEVIQACREHIEKRFCQPIRQYLLGEQRFSEFNALGTFAMRFMPYQFRFIDTEKEPLPPIVVGQYWSWGGITPEVEAEIRRILA